MAFFYLIASDTRKPQTIRHMNNKFGTHELAVWLIRIPKIVAANVAAYWNLSIAGDCVPLTRKELTRFVRRHVEIHSDVMAVYMVTWSHYMNPKIISSNRFVLLIQLGDGITLRRKQTIRKQVTESIASQISGREIHDAIGIWSEGMYEFLEKQGIEGAISTEEYTTARVSLFEAGELMDHVAQNPRVAYMVEGWRGRWEKVKHLPH